MIQMQKEKNVHMFKQTGVKATGTRRHHYTSDWHIWEKETPNAIVNEPAKKVEKQVSKEEPKKEDIMKSNWFIG